MEKKRILFISCLMVDEMYTFSGTFADIAGTKIHTKREIRSRTRAMGGNAITFTCAKRLGFEPVPMGMIGDDDLGDFFRMSFEKEHITAEAVQLMPGYQTPMVMVLVDSEKKHQYLYNSRKRLNETADVNTLTDSCDYLYMCGFSLSTEKGNEDNPERTLSFARRAREKRIPIFFDPGPMFDVMPEPVWKEALTLADYMVMNEVEGEIVTGLSDPQQAARKIAETFGGTALVKAGAAGCAVSDGQQEIFVPSFSVPVVNTNGAGDTFMAGFMLAVDRGLSLQDALTVGNAAAAIKVSRGGAADMTPCYGELQAFLAEHGHRGLL